MLTNAATEALKNIVRMHEAGAKSFPKTSTMAQKITGNSDVSMLRDILGELASADLIRQDLGSAYLLRAGIAYVETLSRQSQPPQPNISFSIGDVSGNAIIGTQTGFTMNVGADIEHLAALISEKPTIDQSVLDELLTLLKSTEASSEPVEKGLLAKFSDMLKKHTDLITPVSNILFRIFTGQ